MAITYAGEIITVTGYSEVTPADFDDVYNAEIDTVHAAGWAEWYRVKSSTSYDANGAVSGYNQPIPLDYVAINLYLRVTVLTGTSFTLNVAGTDANDNAITVALTGINATGEYLIGHGAIGSQVGQAFKTITSMSISNAVGFSTGSCSGGEPCCTNGGICNGADEGCCMEGTPDNCGSQETCENCGGEWTAIPNCNTQTNCEACGGNWGSGNGVTLEIYQKRWGALAKYNSKQYSFDGTLQIGDDSTASYFADERVHLSGGTIIGKANSFIRFGSLYNETNKVVRYGCSFEDTSFSESNQLYFYDCQFTTEFTGWGEYIEDGTDVRLWSCVLGAYTFKNCKVNLYDVSMMQWAHGFNDLKAGNIIKNVRVTGVGVTYLVASEGLPADMTLEEVTAPYGLAKAIAITNSAHDIYFKNCELHNWIMHIHNSPTSEVYRQYTFNLKVTDKDGNNINGATVKIYDKDDNLVVDTTTSSGVITEQTITRGYYNEANGNILQDVSPHLMIIKHYDYTTLESKFEINTATNWTLTMVEDPWITKNKAGATAINGSCS